MRAFIICPVRIATAWHRRVLDRYVAGLESWGWTVHYPPRDVDQSDPVGMDIIRANRKAMRHAHVVHVYWIKGSEGSRVDLGMALALGKPLVLINRPRRTARKSYTNVLRIMAGRDAA